MGSFFQIILFLSQQTAKFIVTRIFISLRQLLFCHSVFNYNHESLLHKIFDQQNSAFSDSTSNVSELLGIHHERSENIVGN